MVTTMNEWDKIDLTFGIAAICDGVDGYIARRYNQRSELGAILDPLADKLLLVSGIVVLSFDHHPRLQMIPLWLTGTIIGRDILLLAGLYSAVIGLVPGALFTALPVHAPRPELVGASTGLLMQGSNIGGLIGPPVTGALVASGGWPAAAWLTSIALGIVAGSALFLHWRERRRVAA